MRKLRDIRKDDRPREKLQIKGPAALSDFELLQALIGSGNARADVSKIANIMIIFDDKLSIMLSKGYNVN